MTTQYFKEATRTAGATARHDFGTVDAKGRTVGARVTAAVVTYEATGDRWGYRDVEPGKRYRVVRVQATRDGADFGASQREQRFETDEAAAAYVAKYLAGARKRASSK